MPAALRFIAIISPDLSGPLEVARALSPRLEVQPPDRILIEVSRRWESDALRHLRPWFQRVRIGVASTRTAALLAARFQSGSVIPPGRERTFLAPLPVGLLLEEYAAPPDLSETLARWGIRRLEELAALSESQLFARLGEAGLWWQRLARGEDPGPFLPAPEEPRFEEEQSLEWPVDQFEPLSFVLAEMLERLCRRLRERGLAAEALDLSLRLGNGETTGWRLRPAFPLTEPKTLLSLLRLELQSRPPVAVVEGMRLRLHPARPRVIQHSLLAPATPHPEKLSRTLGRLYALVGREQVGCPVLLDTHRPDGVRLESVRFEPIGERPQPAPGGGPERIRLALRRFRPPLPFRLVPERIVASAGPWRSSGDWWMGSEEAWGRDEWDLQESDGTLCRVYWDDLRKSWFLEGIYD